MVHKSMTSEPDTHHSVTSELSVGADVRDVRDVRARLVDAALCDVRQRRARVIQGGGGEKDGERPAQAGGGEEVQKQAIHHHSYKLPVKFLLWRKQTHQIRKNCF